MAFLVHSHLKGMETVGKLHTWAVERLFTAYLKGMETTTITVKADGDASSQPT